MPAFVRAQLCAGLFLFAATGLALADDAPFKAGNVETVIVTGARKPAPGQRESVNAQQATMTNNVVSTEDLLRYLPDILIRTRHFGDTQDPITTRTSGVGASARSLIYADGILLSSPLGNNNGTASPHWGLVAPQDVARVDVLYGPFAAEYPGNSIGEVVNITTRMPDGFELYADALGAVQDFRQYATHGSFGTYELAAGIGDSDGPFAWRLSANHLNSNSQPLAYVTLTRPASPSAAGTPVTGAFNGLNRSGVPIAILGAGGFEHQVQDTDTLRATYDVSPAWQIAYTASLFHQQDDATAQTYLRNGAGDPVYSGGVNFEGFPYAIPVSAFSNNIYNWAQTYLAQALSLKSAGSGAWEWEGIATNYAYLQDDQRIPVTALPAARHGGAGAINRMRGTGWTTLDATGIWHANGNDDLSFGIHRDFAKLDLSRFNTPNWISGGAGPRASQSRGKTAIDALWAQNVWRFAPDWQATLGARLEDSHAYDGFNFSAAPALSVKQPKLSGTFASPKASLAWHVSEPWTLSASWGDAYRMPTVTELYQAIATGPTLTVPDPHLKQEHANSYDLSAEERDDDGRVRISLFQENLSDALISQTAPLVSGSTTLFSFVQNIPRVRSRGAEIVADRNDVLFAGLELSGSVTYVDSRILKDPVFPAAVGKQTPQIPRWRGTAVATYRPDDRLAVTLAARYSDRSFATIDNSDPITDTFQGFGSYFVVDTRVRYALDAHWSAAVGVDNLNDDKYFIFHPFPQRTFIVELHYAQ